MGLSELHCHIQDYSNLTQFCLSGERCTPNPVTGCEWHSWQLIRHDDILVMGRMGICFYVGGDLMMRRGMVPIIMLPDGDLRIALHLVPFWILPIWGSVHIEETVVGWRNQVRMKTSAKYLPELH